MSTVSLTETIQYVCFIFSIFSFHSTFIIFLFHVFSYRTLIVYLTQFCFTPYFEPWESPCQAVRLQMDLEMSSKQENKNSIYLRTNRNIQVMWKSTCWLCAVDLCVVCLNSYCLCSFSRWQLQQSNQCHQLFWMHRGWTEGWMWPSVVCWFIVS